MTTPKKIGCLCATVRAIPWWALWIWVTTCWEKERQLALFQQMTCDVSVSWDWENEMRMRHHKGRRHRGKQLPFLQIWQTSVGMPSKWWVPLAAKRGAKGDFHYVCVPLWENFHKPMVDQCWPWNLHLYCVEQFFCTICRKLIGLIWVYESICLWLTLKTVSPQNRMDPLLLNWFGQSNLKDLKALFLEVIEDELFSSCLYCPFFACTIYIELKFVRDIPYTGRRLMALNPSAISPSPPRPISPSPCSELWTAKESPCQQKATGKAWAQMGDWWRDPKTSQNLDVRPLKLNMLCFYQTTFVPLGCIFFGSICDVCPRVKNDSWMEVHYLGLWKTKTPKWQFWSAVSIILATSLKVNNFSQL